jgi:hypothetical protein
MMGLVVDLSARWMSATALCNEPGHFMTIGRSPPFTSARGSNEAMIIWNRLRELLGD